MFSKDHIAILKKALRIIRKKEFNQYENYLRRGIIQPDKYGKTFNHFYDPTSNKGHWYFSNAKIQGTKHFKDAVKLYKKGKKRKAYFNLGKSLHYLTDLAIPAHSLPLIHLFCTDDLENYLKENLNEKIKIKNISPIRKKNVEDYFISIAKKSRKLKTKSNNFWISLKFRILGKKEKLSKEELKSQSKKVVKLAVSYSTGLLEKFYQEIN
ncbi:MAG: zinc dependent phospholipase C family protein [archaeon]